MKCVEKVEIPMFDCIQYTGKNIGEIIHWLINLGYKEIKIHWYTQDYFHISLSDIVMDHSLPVGCNTALYTVKHSDFLVHKDNKLITYDSYDFNICYELSGL